MAAPGEGRACVGLNRTHALTSRGLCPYAGLCLALKTWTPGQRAPCSSCRNPRRESRPSSPPLPIAHPDGQAICDWPAHNSGAGSGAPLPCRTAAGQLSAPRCHAPMPHTDSPFWPTPSLTRGEMPGSPQLPCSWDLSKRPSPGPLTWRNQLGPLEGFIEGAETPGTTPTLWSRILGRGWGSEGNSLSQAWGPHRGQYGFYGLGTCSHCVLRGNPHPQQLGPKLNSPLSEVQGLCCWPPRLLTAAPTMAFPPAPPTPISPYSRSFHAVHAGARPFLNLRS